MSPIEDKEMNGAAKAVADGESLQFVENLLQKEKDSGSSDVDSVYKVMSFLEVLAGQDTATALVLMARLAPKASQLYLHDVWDSINLWMFHEMSGETRKLLAALLSQEPDISMHKQYKLWMEFDGSPRKP